MTPRRPRPSATRNASRTPAVRRRFVDSRLGESTLEHASQPKLAPAFEHSDPGNRISEDAPMIPRTYAPPPAAGASRGGPS
jgi:hypothetical protein